MHASWCPTFLQKRYQLGDFNVVQQPILKPIAANRHSDLATFGFKILRASSAYDACDADSSAYCFYDT